MLLWRGSVVEPGALKPSVGDGKESSRPLVFSMLWLFIFLSILFFLFLHLFLCMLIIIIKVASYHPTVTSDRSIARQSLSVTLAHVAGCTNNTHTGRTRSLPQLQASQKGLTTGMIPPLDFSALASTARADFRLHNVGFACA